MWLCLLSASMAGTAAWVRFPALRGADVVFTAEGDLWRVPVEGGLARRLTSHPGQETNAAISPDGKLVAFTAEYEGPAEVYVVPIGGDLPKRLTYDGDRAVVRGFLPDGRVLYTTRRFSTLPDWQLVAVHPITGVKERLPLAQASDAVADGAGNLFFTRLEFQGSHTRRYRGGTAQNLWRWAPGSEAVPLMPDFAGTSKAPMLQGGRLFFVSDRDGAMNLWSMTLDAKESKQHTFHKTFDVRSPSMDNGRIAYQLGADLHVFTVADGTDRVVPVTLASDLDQLREKWVTDPMAWTSAITLSPSGDRVALTARGLVFTAPVEPGRIVQATHTSGTRWRDATFLPDGGLVALGDTTGEFELYSMPADGMTAPKRITGNGDVLRSKPVVAPQGNRAAWTDNDRSLWVVDLSTGLTTLVEHNDSAAPQDLVWSPDGQWLAYASAAPDSYLVIRLWSPAAPTPIDVTSDRVTSYSPAWDASGDILYFVSDRDLQSVVGSPWGWWQPEPYLNETSGIYGLRLRPDVVWPWRFRTELEPKVDGDEGEKDDNGGKGDKKKDKKKKADEPIKPVVIAFDGLIGRLDRVPIGRGNFQGLEAGKDLLFFNDVTVGSEDVPLKAVKVGPRPEVETLLESVNTWMLSGDRNKLLFQDDDGLFVVDADTSVPEEREDHKVDLNGWALSTTPRDEWRQMVRDAWRMERDFFYDPELHGVDWQAQLDRFLPLADRVTDRAELSDLLSQMVGELSALHIFVFGGDHRTGRDHVEIGALGAELAYQPGAGGWRVVHAYRTDPDYPDDRGPLEREGVNVQPGDIITSINGQPVEAVADLGVLLRGTVGQQVRLGLRRGKDIREAIVVPVSQGGEANLRYHDWEISRRTLVEERGKQRIGYVHLRAMGQSNWTEFVRGFYPVFNREGLIIDVRHNRGGNIDSWVIEKLLRKAWMYWQARGDAPTWNMQYAFRGHIVVLTDAHTASDGEAFAEGVKRLDLGHVLGTRTWGGEIWLSFDTWLVDNGIATAAELGVYGPEGEWLVEGHGVDPDEVVDNPPHETFSGSDRQLEAAIAWLNNRIAEEPRPVPPPPPFPNKAGLNSPPR